VLQNDSASSSSLINDFTDIKHSVSLLMKERRISKFAADAVLIGIPEMANESLRDVFAHLCSAVNCETPQVQQIFRAKQGKSAIIIKFLTPYDRNKTLRAFGDFRKREKRNLILKDAGFDEEDPIYLHESLSLGYRKLLQSALNLKKNKKILQAFAYRGEVYIRINKGDDAIQIVTEDDLKAFL